MATLVEDPLFPRFMVARITKELEHVVYLLLYIALTRMLNITVGVVQLLVNAHHQNDTVAVVAQLEVSSQR